MSNILWLLFELLINMFQAYMFTWFVFETLIYKSKISKKISFSLCSVILFILCSLFNFRIVFEGLGIFIYVLVLLIFSFFFFSGNFLRKIVLCILPFSFVAVSSALSVNTVAVLSRKSALDLMSQQNIYRLITLLIGNVIFVLLTLLIKRFIISDDLNLTKHEWLIMSVVLITSILILLLLYLSIFESTSNNQKIMLVFSISGIILLNITIYTLLIQLGKKQKAVLENTLIKQEYYHQKEFTSALKDQYDQLQKMRHDFSNTLLVIQTLNNEQKHDSINNYITKYIEENKNTLKFVTTNNDYVNAVINSKIALAKKNNINVVFNIYTEIPDINQVDLCNLLNNMFDNAIEACEKCIDNKEISLEIRCDKMSLNFFIKNSIPYSVYSFNPELDTDKKDRKYHGFGTKIIKDIAVKHHGYADFYEESGMFCCNVILNTGTMIEKI